MTIKSLDPRKPKPPPRISNLARKHHAAHPTRPTPTHSLRFDRMLISTCEWLRTAVCSRDSGPLLISQFSYTPSQHEVPSPFSHLPLSPRERNIPTEQSHTPYPNQSAFSPTPLNACPTKNSRALIARLLQKRPVAKNRWSAISQSIHMPLPITDGNALDIDV